MIVVLDCNIWITLTINSQIDFIAELSDSGHLIASCPELSDEIESVLKRPKLAKFVSPETVEKVILMHKLVATNYKIGKIKPVVTDLKDNFLFALASKSKADYLVTGDKLLLAVGRYKKVRIISLADFKHMV